MRQARYNKAIKTRAIHNLQNYGQKEPIYNSQPYTYSLTYHNGQLQLFAHHTTAPTASDSRRKYYTNQLRTFKMTNIRGTLVQGATAFRNIQDLAKQYQYTFIQAANSRHHIQLAFAQENLTIFIEYYSTLDNINRQ